MYSCVKSYGISGIDAYAVTVEMIVDGIQELEAATE